MHVYALLLLAGALAGNFLAVVIMRVPRKETILNKPSFCPQCDHVLSIRDIFPIVGWLLLRGKCRYCKSPIPTTYLALEFACAFIALGIGAVSGDPIVTAGLFALVCFGIFLMATRRKAGAPFLNLAVFFAVSLIFCLTTLVLLIPRLVDHISHVLVG